MENQFRCSLCSDYDSNLIYLCDGCQSEILEDFNIKQRFMLLNGETSRPRQASVVQMKINYFNYANYSIHIPSERF